MDISSGQLNRILIEDKDVFHLEKDEILSAGLKVSDYVNVDVSGGAKMYQIGRFENASQKWE